MNSSKYLQKAREKYNILKNKVKKKVEAKIRKVAEYNITEEITSNKYINYLKYNAGGALGGYLLALSNLPIALVFYKDMKKENKPDFSPSAYKWGYLTYIGSVVSAAAVGEYKIAETLLILNLMTNSILLPYYIGSKINKKYNILTKITKKTKNTLRAFKETAKENLRQMFSGQLPGAKL